MTQLRLFDPLTSSIEPVHLDRQPVTVYVCGITPYDTTHLGHAFTYAVADHLIRLLEYLGHQVVYAQNVTDIDDDILRKAKEVKEDWRELGNQWTTHFLQDMQRLNIRPPDHYPRASDFISQMQEAIEKLISNDLAYVAEGSVYYAANGWQEFGRLSGLSNDELLPTANERGNNADDPHKRHPLDFPLWQAQKPGEPAWESPWGPGRPGWHMECSTMATTILGDSIDFHGGGSDLTFPHHECEIAQAESVTGVTPFVRHWFHTAMVEHEGEKMSKSLGNLVMVRDLLGELTPDALRLYLASHHYRESWTYDNKDLASKAIQAERWSAAITSAGGSGSEYYFPEETVNHYLTALANDLDTVTAIDILDDLASQLQRAATARRDVNGSRRSFLQLASILGLRLVSSMPDPAVMAGWRRHLNEFTDFSDGIARKPS